MEARASLNRPSVSRTFVAAILVIVALGLAAMGGYLAKGVAGSGAATVQTHSQTYAAPGTVLRQDSQSRPSVIATQAPQRPGRGARELD